MLVDHDGHVRVFETHGKDGAESWCGANGIDYHRAVEFLATARRLVKAGDAYMVADLVRFPLRAHVPAETRQEFLNNYDQLFTPDEIEAVVAADPREVFCRNGAFMLGDGEIWAAPDEAGRYRIVGVNPPVPKSMRRR